MHTVDMNKDELFSLIKKAVREVMQEEMGRKWLEGIPVVTDEEQEDISRQYGKPDRTEEIETRETKTKESPGRSRHRDTQLP
jgi:20S proteasome alpha/beta subunit